MHLQYILIRFNTSIFFVVFQLSNFYSPTFNSIYLFSSITRKFLWVSKGTFISGHSKIKISVKQKQI
jgi:hypothetical protein